MPEEEKSYSQMREEFQAKYKNEIVPKVLEYENERKKNLCLATISSCALSLLATVILVALILYYAINGGGKSSGRIGELIVGIYMLSFLTWSIIKKKFENSIKDKIMPIVCECFGNLKWTCSKYQDDGIFLKSYVVQKYTRKSYDDIFEGSYEDVNIDIIESEFIVGSGKNSRTVFDGVIVKLDMNKKFNSHTIIKPDTLLNISPVRELHHIELEDSEFNKKFDVYTNDEVDARYLITPSFMERLKNIKTAFDADKASCAFYDNYLIIALETKKDLFSICSLIKPIDDEEQYYKMYDEMESIIKLIDYFKLNQKLGL